MLAGVVDFGIDCRSPSLDPAVIVVWDQTRDIGGLPHEWRGCTLTGDDRLLCRDPSWHGSNVAAVLAGRGNPTGFAPDADLAVVVGDGSFASVVQGVAWIFDLADQMHMPAVVNLSLGGDHLDPHDGNDELSVALDDLTGPGRLIVAAAGNDRGTALHAQASIAAQTAHRFPFVRIAPEPLPASIAMNDAALAVYGGVDAPFSLRLCAGRRGSDEVLDTSPLVPVGGSGRFRVGGRDVRIDNRGEPLSRRAAARVTIETDASHPPTEFTYWWLEVTAGEQSIDVDVWSRENTAWFSQFDRPSIDDELVPAAEAVETVMLGRPASAHSVITVAAYDDRPDTPAAMCHFSNLGPTADGREKPHVVAPGMRVESVGPDPVDGTSFAAPMVSGTVAGLLQWRGDLQPEEVVALLKSAAFSPIGLNTFSPEWGHGVVNATSIKSVIGLS